MFGEVALGVAAGFLMVKGSRSRVLRRGEERENVKSFVQGRKGEIPGHCEKKMRRRECCPSGVSALSSLLMGRGFLTPEKPFAF